MPTNRIDDIDAVIAQARTEADRRGIKVWPAFMTGKADILFAYPHISVTDVFDVAVSTGAPFVTIDEFEFEEDDAFEGADMTAVLPDHLQRAVLARVGQTSSMTLWWRAGGTTYSYVAIASWEEDLSEKIQAWSETSRAETFVVMQNVNDRRNEMAAFAAADEQVKSAPHKIVVTAAEAVIRERFGDDIDENTLSASAYRAAQKVKRAREEAYYRLEVDMAGTALGLQSDAGWKSARSRVAAVRVEAARVYLTRTTGYQPTAAFTKRLEQYALSGAVDAAQPS